MSLVINNSLPSPGAHRGLVGVAVLGSEGGLHVTLELLTKDDNKIIVDIYVKRCLELHAW